MSLERIAQTSLWKSSLSTQPNDEFEIKREELRSSFLKFRENASQLVSRISTHLPGLTQHDITHLDALWETASLIAGESYPLNALEGFVLGGAILLHDSALCFEAYDNGTDGVRETTIWKDAYTAASEAQKNQSQDLWKYDADFTALRHLHAEQSARLIEMCWINPATKESIYLVENQALRTHLGQIIGQISASHHWDIEKVAMALPKQVNALASFPREWRIDPIKLACLLRCADAAHIDNERAPDFLHALVKRQGISFNHWQAQNSMASIDLDQSDTTGSTVLFTSTRSFTESESDSWWVAYDATCLVDKEIRSSNALLESRNGSTPPFKVKRVKGVESPEIMANYIQTKGWSPCSAELHVGNIERLVKNLGGQTLYGTHRDTLEITIRELVQNSLDSIQARKIIDPSFKGKILIKVCQRDGSIWLMVEDDGVGMSERVLTGPLLDFGTSFWTSSLVQSEFPGLRSSKFEAIGQFGIGFYSIFMVAQEVSVTSRPWREGAANARQLHFKDGLSFRPLLKNGYFEDFSSLTSTQVILRLKSDVIPANLKIEVKRNLMNSENLLVNIKDYLSAICAGLDVSVYYSDNDTSEIEVHQAIGIDDFKKEQWLRRISFAEYQPVGKVSSYITENADRLRPIIENEKVLGLAAISTQLTEEQNFLSVRTIGGLASSVHERNGSTFIGFIDSVAESAKRDISNTNAASEVVMTKWAKEQFQILNSLNLDFFEKYATASNLCHFKVDPTSIASILVMHNKNQLFLTFEELAQLNEQIDIAIFKSNLGDGDHAERYHSVNHLDGYALIRTLTNSTFSSLKMNLGIPENNYSIIDCLHRTLIKRGKSPSWRIEKSVAPAHFSGLMDALVVSVRT